jgi:hypothetical protein
MADRLGILEDRRRPYHDQASERLLSVLPRTLPLRSADCVYAPVSRMLTFRLHMGMSYSYYILLYTAIYDFCTQNRPTVGAFGGGGRGGASLQGADLYRSLHQYLSEHCRQLREVRLLTPVVPEPGAR